MPTDKAKGAEAATVKDTVSVSTHFFEALWSVFRTSLYGVLPYVAARIAESIAGVEVPFPAEIILIPFSLALAGHTECRELGIKGGKHRLPSFLQDVLLLAIVAMFGLFGMLKLVMLAPESGAARNVLKYEDVIPMAMMGVVIAIFLLALAVRFATLREDQRTRTIALR